MRGVALGAVALLFVATAGSVGLETTAAPSEPPPSQESLCLPSCELPWTRFAPGSPVVLTSGSTVTWTSVDADYHTATSEDFCFDVAVDAGDPGWARLWIEDGALYAVDRDNPDTPRRCSLATPLAGGAFLVAYGCFIHPAFQKGTLLVLPEAPA